MSEKSLSTLQREMVEEHVEFAVRLARKFHSQRPNTEFDVEDFEGAALLGLCDAARRFDLCRGMNFRTFAYLRVRGAMLDALRNGSGIPRRQFSRMMQNSQNAPAGAVKAAPAKDENIPYSFARSADELRALIEVLDDVPLRLAVNARGGLEPTYAAAKDPEHQVSIKLCLERLRTEIKRLPEREQAIMRMRYEEGRSFGEIGEVLGGLSKSWVSRMHAAAIRRVRSTLEKDASQDSAAA